MAVPDAAAGALDSAAGMVAKREARTHASRFLLLPRAGQSFAAASAGLRPNSLRRNAAAATSPNAMNFFRAMSAPSSTLNSPAFAARPPAISAAMPY